ncbi:unnamed protein product [Brachionus calyciflorus]|uniref:Uncharacterized protein n=1 Tax=Brachionus calyciflorus TaxID=104777 RepID=A0A814HMA8_9BILA|nr:unnamed protein product [Brachionus calyciflorus]
MLQNLTLILLIGAIYLGYFRNSEKKYIFNNFDPSLKQFPLIYEENFFDSKSLEKLDKIVKSTGEAKPIEDPDCRHPYMVSKNNNTFCAFPSRIDIGEHYLKTGGFENHMEKYETMTARVMTFRHKFLDEHSENSLKEIYGDKFLFKAREICHKNDPNNYKLNNLIISLFQFDVILMLPGQELPMHLDIPYFWGADRKNIPHWLLSLMKQSSLFDEHFIPQVQGVSWLSRHQYKKLEIESAKNGGNFYFYPYVEEKEKFVLAKSEYNSALLVDGTQVVHGVERFKSEFEQPPLEKNKKYYLSYEANEDSWGLYDQNDKKIKEYKNDDLRVSLVWRVHCFKDMDEKVKYDNQKNDDRLSVETVLDIFKNDMKARNKNLDENMSNLEFLIKLIEEYSVYSNKIQNGLPVFNYCLIPLVMPKILNDYFFNYLFYFIC